MGKEFFRTDTNCGYAVSHLPGRKRVALCRTAPGRTTAVAYFTDEDEAEQFMDWLSALVRLINPNASESQP